MPRPPRLIQKHRPRRTCQKTVPLSSEPGRSTSAASLRSGLAAFLGRLREKTAALLEVIGRRVILSFTLLGPFEVLLLDGLFYPFFRALIHEEIITGEPSDSSQEGARRGQGSMICGCPLSVLPVSVETVISRPRPPRRCPARKV
jgi:hypothetical protein